MKYLIKSRLLLKFICLFLFAQTAYSQSTLVFQDTLIVKDSSIILDHFPFVVDSILSLKLFPDNIVVTNYLFDREKQQLLIYDRNLINRKFVILYKAFPIKREATRKNYPQIRKDTVINRTFTQIKTASSKNLTDEIFGSRIERSGSISRGFSFGTNRDFTINSGLRLQMAGQLSDDVEVVAVLSDQSSPIQPEGNTRTLQEIDKVYIDIKHKYAQATFGDFQFSQKVGTFGVVDKKLQGLKASAFSDENNSAIVSYATARGKFKSQQFMGIDGVQGPYRLTGENNERDIIVLAGTEKVFINGEEKTRGENYDYTIDYSTGEIYFTPKVVITNASRIRVDFEYSDRKFERNFFGTSINSKIFSEKLTFGFSYFREGDNQDLPIDISLSEFDRKILSSSGNDRLKASKSGIKFVGFDTTGKPVGTYIKKDTIINNQIFQFYEYGPGSDSAFYNISFSFIGEGMGDYIRVGLGRYKFVGPGKGNYLPIILLPMPELKQLSNFYSRAFLTKNLYVEGELSLSSYDKNRFSVIDDDKNKGKAHKYTIGVDSIEINVLKTIDGKFSINYSERKIDGNYSPLSRIFEVEYERNWNLGQLTTAEELTRELQLIFFRKNLNTKFSLGKLQKGSSLKTERIVSETNAQLFNNLSVNYSLSSLKSKSIDFNSAYQKSIIRVNYYDKNFTPYTKIEYENKQDRKIDSLLQSSFKFYDIGFGFESNSLKYLDWNTSFVFRQDYFPIQGVLEREANNYIYQISLKLKNIQNISSMLDVSFRQKKYSEIFKSAGSLDNKSLAIKYVGRGFFFRRFLQSDVYYEASSQKSARFERVFIRVPKGSGQYIYKGDLNNNGVADEFEFEPTRFEGDYVLTTYPTDELFPVTDLKASLRIRLDFRNLYFFVKARKILSPLTTETYFRVEENSQDPNETNIYLVKLQTFQNPATTIRGNKIIQQDFNLFEYNPDFNIHFRFIEKKGFSKFSLNDEKRFQQDKLIRLRFKPLKEFANQSEINFNRNEITSSNYLLRNFNIRGVNFSSKIFYYPYVNVETAFKLELNSSKDFYPVIPTELKLNTQELSLSVMFSLRGKISLSVERTEMLINQTQNYLPFELTRGYLPGKNYIWRILTDYQFGSGIQTSFVYDGRVQGKNNPIHTATAEIRAYF